MHEHPERHEDHDGHNGHAHDGRGPGGLLAPPKALDRPAEVLQRGVGTAFDAMPLGGAVQGALRGRPWLGHPLHPLLTDIVTGAWTVAWVFDVMDAMGNRRLRDGADAAVALGLAASPITALSGLVDWRQTSGATRRLGLVHASLNGLVSVSYAMSLVARRDGRRTAARRWGHLGFALLNVSAYLGGELVYDAGVQVKADHQHEGHREPEGEIESAQAIAGQAQPSAPPF